MTGHNRDLRSQSLDLLRFPLALFVSAVHIFTMPLNLENQPLSDFPATEILFRFIHSFIADQSVPVYYFIAGYVFFLGLDFTIRNYRGKLQRRVHSLLIPYLIWNTLAIILTLKPSIPEIIANPGNLHDIIPNFTFSGFINCYWNNHNGFFPSPADNSAVYPIDGPLWFIRDLMIIVLISPAIYSLYRLPKRHCLFFLSVITLIWALRIPGSGRLSQLMDAFTFFSWGGVLSYHKHDMTAIFSRFRVPSFILYPLIATIIFILNPHYPELMAYFKSLNIIIGLFFFYNMAAMLIGKNICRPNKFLAKSSFFIYCGHVVFKYPIAGKLSSVMAPTDDLSLLIFLFALYFLIIFALLITYLLMKRFTPRILALFNGGRI